MKDLEQQLISVLDEDARETPTAAPPPTDLTAHIRRRQLGTVLLIGLTVLGLLGASIAGLRGFTTSSTPAVRTPSAVPAFHHNGDIIVMSQDGLSSVDPATGSRHHLVACPGPCVWLQNLVWSPDGTKLAYVIDAHSSGALPSDLGIWVLDPATGRSRQLTRFPPPSECTTPLGDGYISWASDGSRIAFEQCGGIYIMNIDGTDKSRVTTFGSDPTFSPSGSQIAFVGFVEGRGYALYVVDADGSHLQRLTSSRTQLGEPAWSPDGQKIAYERDAPFEILKINVDGSLHPARLFFTDRCCYASSWGGPSWSPDGEKLAFVVGAQLHVMDANGSRSRSLSLAGFLSPVRPAWRPVP